MFFGITQTAVINIVFKRIFIELDVSYASQHTFSKVTVTIFENCYIYTINNRGHDLKFYKSAFEYNVYHRCLCYFLNQVTMA